MAPVWPADYSMGKSPAKAPGAARLAALTPSPALIYLGFRAGQTGLSRRKGREWKMAQRCDLCGKGPQFGNRVSHAHNVTHRRFNPNLQKVRAVLSGVQKRVKVCTRCLRSGKVTKPTPQRKTAVALP